MPNKNRKNVFFFKNAAIIFLFR